MKIKFPSMEQSKTLILTCSDRSEFSAEFSTNAAERGKKSSWFPRWTQANRCLTPEPDSSRNASSRPGLVSRTATPPVFGHNPSICPQFLLAAKPQTYKGGGSWRRIGERSALTPLCGPQFHPSLDHPFIALFRTPLSACNSYFLPCV